MRNRYAYLGPEGTFTEAALRVLHPDAGAGSAIPCTGVEAVFDAVRSGAADSGVVPLENSVEGGVPATTAELVFGAPLMITAEAAVPVEFTLFARPGAVLDDVKHVATHGHALAQCRRWLGTALPDAETHTASSTAAAAQAVADPGSPYDAAVCARIAGERYGLVPLATGIGERSDAATRFVEVALPGRPPAPTGADRTSIVAFPSDDHAGALAELLEQFAVRGINLTRLDSRPTGDGLGRYCFCLDADGHVADAALGEALMGLYRVCSGVRFLGSYPRAGGYPGAAGERAAAAARPGHGVTEGDFRAAAQWLEGVRSGRR